jgi:hypothetical protein
VASGRGPRICLIVVFLALLGIVAPSQIVFELRERETPQIANLFRQTPTRANLRRLESDLESRCRLAQAVRPWVQYARFVLLQDAGDKALLGRSDWFFYRPAAQYLVEPCALPTVGAKNLSPLQTTNDIFTAIVSFRDDLAKRGIKLLVMPAPNKSSVYPQMLATRASSTVNLTTREALARLQQAGVEIIDLFEAYGPVRSVPARASKEAPRGVTANYYLAQDSHWSPEGMHLAADVVARKLLDSGWVEKGPSKYELKPARIKRYGDVLRMIHVPQVERLYEPEQIDATQVINTVTGRPYVDDPNSPVLVLGDSFLRIFERDEPGSAGFIAHLARNLGFGLTSIINDGGASTLVRQQLARKPALLQGKKVVIWEFVERDIRFGTEGWQVIPIP